MATLKRRVATVELADGQILTVRITHPDVLKYQETAQKHGWPSLVVQGETGKVPHVDYEDTFVAWAALRRTEQYAGGWEDFKAKDCIELEIELEEVIPTQLAMGGPISEAAVASLSSLPTPPAESASTG